MRTVFQMITGIKKYSKQFTSIRVTEKIIKQYKRAKYILAKYPRTGTKSGQYLPNTWFDGLIQTTNCSINPPTDKLANNNTNYFGFQIILSRKQSDARRQTKMLIT